MNRNYRLAITSRYALRWVLAFGAVAIGLLLFISNSVADPAPDPNLATVEHTAAEIAEAERSGETTTNPEAADGLSKSSNPTEALEAMEGVFGQYLEASAGIFDELEVEKFLSNNVAVVAPGEALPGGETAQGPALLESTLPLRTNSLTNEAVNLSLEPAEGELQAANPLVEVGIPTELGEGIELPGVQVQLARAASSTATLTPQNVAFYPNVAPDTDLAIAPTPTGVKTFSQLRTPEAPDTQTYELSLPTGASLRSTPEGGAEATVGNTTILNVLPPTAVDAAGNPVDVAMSVSSDSLVVESRPTAATEYPVLVDPNLEDLYHWESGAEGWTGWTSYKTPPSQSVNTYNQPEHGCSTYCYLFVSANPGGWIWEGTQTYWNYAVPRFQSDYEKYGSRPTSWIGCFTVGNMVFSGQGDSGISPGAMFTTSNEVGAWITSAFYPPNQSGGYGICPEGKQAKMAAFGLFANGNSVLSQYRYLLVGYSQILLVDEDAPRIMSLTPPSGWTTGTSATVGYALEDTGLGVRSAIVRGPGETAFQPGYGVDFACTGTTRAPCPRKPTSTEPGLPQMHFDPKTMPTGIDTLEVMIGDPFWNSGHTATGTVPVKVDNTAPELGLSGPLTEQETLGTTLVEYPLAVSATDGAADEPQSGIIKVEVKVDGKKIAMPNESAWNPNCTTQSCSVSGSWTLKSSEYTLGVHEIEVLATDAVGLKTATSWEIELGLEPLQTSFTSPHPTYAAHEIPTISFKGTREGNPVEGVTFKCSLDGGETPTTNCSSPYKIPANLKPAVWHTLSVAAVDKSGTADPTPARWRFKTGDYVPAPPSEKLIYPETGKKTASYYTLEAGWGANPEGKAGQGVTGVTFEMKLPKWNNKEPVFEPVPAECVIDGQGHRVSWPLDVRNLAGKSRPVYLKVRGCPVFEEAGYPEKEIQFRAVFDGSEKVAGASEPAATEFVYTRNATRVPTDATEAVGPASVDLLTGAFSVNRTDVSIPVPGYEANLEFTRTYKSTQDGQVPAYSKVMGGLWQPSSPLESEYEGEAWTRIEERVIPAKSVVMGKACWNEEGEEVSCGAGCPSESCEEWVEEEAQPEERWIELFDSEGNGVPFEIVNGKYVSPEYAQELKLTLEGENFVLGYPNGTRTTFRKDGALDWLPSQISYQATPGSMRMVYKTETGSKSLRLEKEIAPSPVACGEESEKQVGCRTLVMEYGTPTGGAQLLIRIHYYGPSGNPALYENVAEYTYATMSGLEGHSESVLTGESNPRMPSVWENYSYSGSPFNLLTSVVPHGQEPWSFGYEFGSTIKPSRLKSVSRAGATTTIAYGVPVSGSGAPYAMSPESIATWGQTDFPVDATAVFPPAHVPSEYPPHEYAGATVHYLDPDGYQVNVASPSPPGVAGASIATTETDRHGDVLRELDPQNRLNALEASNTVARSHELDSHSIYNAAGTEQLESWGPQHKVRLSSGEVVEARQHSVTRYDEGAPAPLNGTPPAYLPTKEVGSVVVPGKEGELEPRVTETQYDWGLRMPTETVVDPGGLNIRSVTVYKASGQVVQTRQPKNPEGGGAGTTQTIYYTVGTSGECVSSQYANLPCKIQPAAQVSGTGRPKLLVKRFTAYNNLDEPTVLKESAGGEGEERITSTTYDKAGRPVSTKIEGGGSPVPRTRTTYSATIGAPTRQEFVCTGTECGTHYVSSIGAYGTGNSQFTHPANVALGSKGNTWVVDERNNRLQEFTKGGEFIKSLGSLGSGNGQFKWPTSMAFAANGNFWVADAGNSRLQEFNEKGEFIKVAGVGVVKSPDSIAIDAKGNIWAADTGNSRVIELNEKGEFIKTVGPAGLGEIIPIGITSGSGGNVWVTDSKHDRVVELSESGELVRTFGSEGTGNGQFVHPAGIAVSANGMVWVDDVGRNIIQGFNQSGEYLTQFGTYGTGTGQFYLLNPAGMAFDSEGNLFIADDNNNRVQKWATALVKPEATTTTYNALGQVTEYEDADGNKTKTTYDASGRPVTSTDAKGPQTITYDPASGLPTRLEVSGIGTFTARYDVDGDLVETNLPNGITAKRTYNAVGEPMALTYSKTSSCGTSCTWFEETLERGTEGRILANSNSLANDHYLYDKAGRLTESLETPIGGPCTTRAYAYDADSNRLNKTVREPGIGTACSGSGGTTQSYEYDGVDRLMGSGITYDNWGRIESLPGSDAGGSMLATHYFSTNMVARQEQNGITNSYELDATGRQRARLQGGGGLEGIEIFHYDGPGDSPAWTELGSTWSRNISGIGGELAAVQESSGTITFKLTDLHGDAVASASASPTATKLLTSFRFDEFGEPESGSAGRFGWLGGHARRTELSSGVIQMGARSYIPSLGRFLTPDPVTGGSANAYDYGNQDPINELDLAGEFPNPGKTIKRAVHKANARGGIVVKFKTRSVAVRFVHYLQHSGNLLERLEKKIGNWKAAELREVQGIAAKARREENPLGLPKPPSAKPPSDCADVGVASATAGIGVALAPETFGISAGVAIGTLGFLSAIGASTESC